MIVVEKPVRRKVPDRDLVVELSREGIRTREKGRRTWYGPITYGRLFTQLAREEADARIAARKRARKEKAAGKRKGR